MANMWTDNNGFFYEGDCRIGDRAATESEVAAFKASQRYFIRVSPWQIRKALNQLGLRQAVEDAVAAGSQDIKDGWEFATELVENDSFVIELGQVLGKSDEELHAVFILAQSL